MKPSSVAERVSDCPHREMLEAFCVGRLSPHFLESIAAHVSVCGACRAILDAFPQDSDALVAQLRACAGDRTRLDDPECQRLESTARAILVSQPPKRTAREFSAPLELADVQIGLEIGAGPHGIVYRAARGSAASNVAVKRLFPSLALTPQQMQHYASACGGAALAARSGLRPILDTLTCGEERLIVAPFIEGTHLGQIIADRKAARRGRPRRNGHRWAMLDDLAYLEQVLHCFERVLEALSFLHQSGLAHGGVKPTNVVIDACDRPWLCDFGLYLLVAPAAQREAFGIQTPAAYVSPEQWESTGLPDARADLFCLGTLIYRALTLELPFGIRHVQPTDHPPMPPRRWQPLLMPGLDEFLLETLHPNPRKRPRDATQVLDQWRRLQRGQTPTRTWTRAVQDAWTKLRRPFGA